MIILLKVLGAILIGGAVAAAIRLADRRHMPSATRNPGRKKSLVTQGLHPVKNRDGTATDHKLIDACIASASRHGEATYGGTQFGNTTRGGWWYRIRGARISVPSEEQLRAALIRRRASA